ncbi:hypothetical protein MKW92_021331 [Papaver armeniacum]|nr:hypothetical protein MKW92_021331 [Papaver armeniacum]
MCKRSLLNLVYKRRNSNSILAVVGKNNIKGGHSFHLYSCSAVGQENNRNCVNSGGSLSYSCSAANLVYQRKKSTRFVAAGQESDKGPIDDSLTNNFSAPNFVYRRRNSASLPAAAGLGNEKNRSVGRFSYNCSAPNLVYKRRKAANLLAEAERDNNSNGSGGCLADNCSRPNFVYRRRNPNSLLAEAECENNSCGCLTYNRSTPCLVYQRKISNNLLTTAGGDNNRQGTGGCLSYNCSAPSRKNSTNHLAEAGQGNSSGGSLSYDRPASKLVYKRRNPTSFPTTQEGEDNRCGGVSPSYDCSAPILVYKRRNYSNLLAAATWENKENNSGGCASYNCSAPTLVYKRKKSTNLLAAARRENKDNSCGGCLCCICSVPNLVYKRRKTSNLPTAELKNNKEGSGKRLCCRCSEMPSLSAENDRNIFSNTGNDSHTGREDPVSASCLHSNVITANGRSSLSQQVFPEKFDIAPCMKPIKAKSPEISLKRINMECSIGEVEEFDEAQNNCVQKSAFGCCNVNDSCSSAKSYVDGSGSMKSDLEDAGECSSSDILTTNQLGAHSTEKGLIYILLRDVLHQQVCSRRKSTSNDVVGSSSAAKYKLQSCKICDGLENSLSMLICDNCEEAFHITCCNPKVRKIPVDEWYCQPCSRKQRRLPRKSLNARASRRKSAAPKDHIASMLSDTEPYTTGVRIGKDFQADVPDWSGPISSDVDFVGKAMDPTECDTLCELNAKKLPAPSSAGNWLQCQEVLVENTEVEIICGKWRRAPLFEVQTDDWDCSCALRWDPIHADCAVPQELPTDQVLKQLKFIEMLKPKLAAKKQKLTHTKGDTEDIRSVT